MDLHPPRRGQGDPQGEGVGVKRVVVHLEFFAEDDADDNQFGEDVLCAIERSPEFATEVDGTLLLVKGSV